MMLRLMKTTALLALLVAVVFLLAPAAQAGDAADLYKAKCASCHAADGTGNTPVGKKMNVPDLTTPELQKKSSEELAKMIAEGGEKKLATHQFAKRGLTPEQIDQLVEFVRGLGKK